MPRTEDAAGECDSNATLCDNCCKAMQMRLVCARCKTATYCSKDCQIKAWKAGHKGECVAAARASTGTAAALRDFSKAIEYHTQCLAIAKEVGDRAGEGRAYGSLGNAYRSHGDYAKAIEYHSQDLAIAMEVGDRAGEGWAYESLGNAYASQGDYSKAI